MGDADYQIGMDVANLRERANGMDTRIYALETPPDFTSFAVLRDEMAGMLAEARALLGGASEAAQLAAETASDTAGAVGEAIDAIAEASASASAEVSEAVGELPDILSADEEADTPPKRVGFFDRKILGG